MKKRRLDSLLFLCYYVKMDREHITTEDVIKYLSLPEDIGGVKVDLDETIKKLRRLESIVKDGLKITDPDDFDTAMELFSDLDWELDGIESAIVVIEDYATVEVEVSQVCDELIWHLDDDQVREILEQKIVDKLRGKK